MKKINPQKLNPFHIMAAFIAGLVVYLYDDLLWGPGPIALATTLFGRVPGLIGLFCLYFIGSFIGASLILRHYQNKKKSSVQTFKATSRKRRKLAYSLLLTGKWLSLAIACFMLGAIVTAVPVGKYKLFPKVNIYLLAAIMSFLFAFLFLGFYTGLFGVVWYLINLF